MTLTVKLFGPQAVLAGRREVSVELADAPTAADVLTALRQAEPKLGESLERSRLAVNHAFVSPDHVVSAGDEVAVIGMVSGG